MWNLKSEIFVDINFYIGGFYLTLDMEGMLGYSYYFRAFLNKGSPQQ